MMFIIIYKIKRNIEYFQLNEGLQIKQIIFENFYFFYYLFSLNSIIL